MSFCCTSKLLLGCEFMRPRHANLFWSSFSIDVPQVKASSLNVVIEPLRGIICSCPAATPVSRPTEQPTFLTLFVVCVGIRGNPPYMDHQLSKAVKSESTWTFGNFYFYSCDRLGLQHFVM
jgi:hypothetical protein